MAVQKIKVCFWVDVEIDTPLPPKGLIGTEENPFRGFASITPEALMEKAIAENKALEAKIRRK